MDDSLYDHEIDAFPEPWTGPASAEPTVLTRPDGKDFIPDRVVGPLETWVTDLSMPALIGLSLMVGLGLSTPVLLLIFRPSLLAVSLICGLLLVAWSGWKYRHKLLTCHWYWIGISLVLLAFDVEIFVQAIPALFLKVLVRFETMLVYGWVILFSMKQIHHWSLSAEELMRVPVLLAVMNCGLMGIASFVYDLSFHLAMETSVLAYNSSFLMLESVLKPYLALRVWQYGMVKGYAYLRKLAHGDRH